MRERIIDRLREAARLSEFDRGRWHDLRERLGEIAISTIDAFCLSLLREFPPSPDDVFRCDTCSFAAVCRKDYVGDV